MWSSFLFLSWSLDLVSRPNLVQTCSNHRIADCRSETGVPWLILRCSLKFLSLRNTKVSREISEIGILMHFVPAIPLFNLRWKAFACCI